MRPPPKVAVTAPNWLGDAVMSMPLIGMLSGNVRIRLCVMVPPYTARVYWGVEGIDELLVFSNEGIFRGLRRRARTLRSLGASAMITLPPSFSSAAPPFFARIPVRIGYRTDGRQPLLTDAIPAQGLRDEHLSRGYLRLGKIALERLGLDEDHSFSIPKLHVFPNERSSLDRRLNKKKAPQNGFCLVVPGAAYGSAKSWPSPLYKEAVRLIARSMPVIVAGSSREKEMCSRIASDMHNAFDFSGETTLGEFFALIERAGVLVANDSGAPHVAGSLGTPSVVIFGSTSPRWTSPLGEQIMILTEPTHCSPCFLKDCPTDLECFERIHPEMVAESVTRLLKKKSISP